LSWHEKPGSLGQVRDNRLCLKKNEKAMVWRWQNPNIEARNSKQIQIANVLMTKTKKTPPVLVRLLFGAFEFWSLGIVSGFGFRASDFDK